MGIKFFCNKCGIEIFQRMSQEMKDTDTVAEVERQCVCLDCILGHISYKREKINLLDVFIRHSKKLGW